MENNIIQMTVPVQKSGKSRRGFASMNKERHKLVSSKGGKAIRTTFTNRNTDTGVAANASVAI
jgi:hypothetical protein